MKDTNGLARGGKSVKNWPKMHRSCSFHGYAAYESSSFTPYTHPSLITGSV